MIYGFAVWSFLMGLRIRHSLRARRLSEPEAELRIRKGGGCMLWIMRSPERAFALLDTIDLIQSEICNLKSEIR